MNVNLTIEPLVPPAPTIDWLAAATQPDPNNDPMKLPHDPLVLSCASHRRYLETGYRWQQLDDCEPTTVDHQRAQEIRAYYQGRITFMRLASKPLSQFQQDLYAMLLGPVLEKHRGMLYRVPYFYEEDLHRERLRDHFAPLEIDHEKRKFLTHPSLMCLRPVTRILRSRRRREVWEYWFRQQFDHGVCWSVDINNPLRSIIEGLYRRDSVNIQARVRYQEWRGFTYMIPHDTELL